MKAYYKIPLNTFINKFKQPNCENPVFSVNNHKITLEDVKQFVYDNEFLNKENKTASEKIIYDIVFTIHNPENIHNGSIVIEKDKNQNLSVFTGLECVIAALYHKENFIIVSSLENYEHDSFFANAIVYKSLENINYDFTNLIKNDDNNPHKQFHGQSFDYAYPEVFESSQAFLDNTWKNKEYILQQIANNRLEIKQLIPVAYLNDESFMLEMIHVNYEVLYKFYDFFSQEFEDMLMKTLYSLPEDNLEIFSRSFNSFLNEYYTTFYNITEENGYTEEDMIIKSKEQQFLITRLLHCPDLVFFIVNNSFIKKLYHQRFKEFLAVLPETIFNIPEIFKVCLENFHYFMLSKISPDFFNNIENVASLFVFINCSWHNTKHEGQSYVKNFFKRFDYSYNVWHNDSQQALVLLNTYLTKKGNINAYYDNSYAMFHMIYSCLSEQLKNNVDFLKEFILIYPKIFEYYNSSMQKEKQLIDAYLYHVSYISEYECPVKKDYFFTIKDPVLILKIVNGVNNLLFDTDCPKNWIDNVDYYKQSMIGYFQKFPETIQEQICSDVDYLQTVIEKYFYIYKHLNLKAKSDKNIILNAAKVHCFLFEEVPSYIWLQESFCFEVFKVNSNVLKYLPQKIINSVSFILNVYHFYSTTKLSHSDSITYAGNIKSYFAEITKLLGHYEADEDYYDFLYNYFSNQQKYHLYQRLQEKSCHIKHVNKKVNKI